MFFDNELGSTVKKGRIVIKEGLKALDYPRKERTFISNAELAALPKQTSLIFDVECYKQYFIVCFKVVGENKYFWLEFGQANYNEILYYILSNHLLIGFNSLNYDIPMLYCSLWKADTYELREVSDDIIIYKNNDYRKTADNALGKTCNHIDIKEVCPLNGSLKLYAGRLFAERMQDLPEPESDDLTQDDKDNIKDYCFNDCDNTELLLLELKEEIALRYTLSERYKVDLRSKSDAQIAEAALKEEIERLSYTRINKPKFVQSQIIRYSPPHFLSFKTEQLKNLKNRICNLEFKLSEKGKPYFDKPEDDDEKRKNKKIAEVHIGIRGYTVGLGGLHSTEKSVAVFAGDNYELIDADVASYYPRIVINTRLAPKHLGDYFLDAYTAIVDERVEAKNKKLTVIANSLKIVANGSFGKLGSMWSILYSPDLMLQVTLGGQLFLLMLIEELELAGITVVSGNTDGIVSRVHKSKKADYERICKAWQEKTGFELEYANYKALYSKDVNNYIAIKTDDTVKRKGAYCDNWKDKKLAIFRFHKNPENLICIKAVSDLLVHGTQIEKTVKACTDIKEFVSVKNVEGGAQKDGIYLGKVVRWYYARNIVGEILYKKNGNKVSNTEGAKPLMMLPKELPDDIDYDRYILESYSILKDIGYYNKRS